ncbi:MAG: ABC transporter substrate-binding protein, partial [Actinomycetota bacterium]
MRRTLTLSLALGLVVAGACTEAAQPLRIGAIYPLSGTQGPGGVDELRGVRVAVELINADGGVDGRPVELVTVDVPSGDAAPGAIEGLAAKGIELVLGSYGSTISEPAAAAAARRGLLFWETGAVGEMTGDGAGELVFRVAPSGAVLGTNAIAFVADEYAPVLGVDPSTLRYAVML